MEYPYLSLEDDTEIYHSDLLDQDKVKVYVRRQEKDGSLSEAVYLLPDFIWLKSAGFNKEEQEYFEKLIQQNSHLILDFADHGGVMNLLDGGMY